MKVIRSLSEIANEIDSDWEKVSVYARPYLDAMKSLTGVNDSYGADSGMSVVLYFLANAGTWRGPIAREIKSELKSLAK